MVCIYCGSGTQVINSRLQKRVNQVWRRRKCVACGAVFSTHEAAAYDGAWRVKDVRGKLVPFSRNKLLVSLYKSLEHRQQPLADAEGLLDTIMGKLIKTAQNGLLDRKDIIKAASGVLKRFDTPASVHYAAFHRG
ncbi:MAG TPA: hypothetical protein VFH39_02735 [Candidatus Saccharimonadales bacterium]|nr:hypothetical protein [Candidatus Saccharimonadales bacterium]